MSLVTLESLLVSSHSLHFITRIQITSNSQKYLVTLSSVSYYLLILVSFS